MTNASSVYSLLSAYLLTSEINESSAGSLFSFYKECELHILYNVCSGVAELKSCLWRIL